MVAFANADGGTVLIGIDDSGQILGVDKKESVVRDDMTRFIDDQVRPKIVFSVNSVYASR